MSDMRNLGIVAREPHWRSARRRRSPRCAIIRAIVVIPDDLAAQAAGVVRGRSTDGRARRFRQGVGKEAPDLTLVISFGYR